MNIDKYDIVIVDEKPLQYLGKEMDNGAIVQDIHTKEKLIHINLISRKANKDETKWFCERTEHINFIAPSSNVLQHRNKLTKKKMSTIEMLEERQENNKSSHYVSVKISPTEYNHFKVDEAVKTYIQQLENALHNEGVKNTLIELYPRLKHKNKDE